MKPQKGPKSESGFSTIELMVALILTTIMLASSIPAFNRYRKTHELIGCAENFAADLRLCRQRATTQGNNFVFTFNTTDMTYTILDDVDSDGNADSGEGTIGPKDLGDGMTLTNDSFAGSSVTFLPSGSTNQGGQVTITNEAGLSRAILVLRPTSLVKIL